MHRHYLIAVVALVCCVHPLRAQSRADTTIGFRRGQWGVEFIPGTSFTTVGVLRFSTPARAWVLDGSGAFNHQTGTGTGFVNESTSSVGVGARFGPRWYHAEFERVVRFVGLGFTGSYFGSTQSASNPYRAESWSAGAYGELGLQYLFTPHLALGVRGMLDASAFTNRSTQNNITTRATSYSFVLSSPQVIGAFYF